jgi:hypothetical protein
MIPLQSYSWPGTVGASPYKSRGRGSTHCDYQIFELNIPLLFCFCWKKKRTDSWTILQWLFCKINGEIFWKKKKKRSSSKHVLVIIEFECQVVNNPNILANNFSRNLYFLYEKGRKEQTNAHTRHVRPHMHIHIQTLTERGGSQCLFNYLPSLCVSSFNGKL